MPVAPSASVLQRSETNFVLVLLCTSVTSALMSWTLNVTPLWVTGNFGSGTRIAAGAHAWQMPHQVGMQRPLFWPTRFAHFSPIFGSHSLSSVHALRDDCASMPCAVDTAFSTSATPNAAPYFADGDCDAAPSHL